ncbi:MAG TPA: GNAT family N-acetyltransferase, partial [Flavobacteriales bacterium]|nr:GNAT family N-acetyltransferase [Flavobacteriales bacterium]
QYQDLLYEVKNGVAWITNVLERQRANTCVQWGITLKGSDTVIGVIGPWRLIPEHHRGELGYTLAREHWGQGLITEAIAAVVDHSFNVFGLHSLEAWTNPANVGSMCALEKNGFVREAYFKENIFWEGSFQDSVVYARRAAE